MWPHLPAGEKMKAHPKQPAETPAIYNFVIPWQFWKDCCSKKKMGGLPEWLAQSNQIGFFPLPQQQASLKSNQPLRLPFSIPVTEPSYSPTSSPLVGGPLPLTLLRPTECVRFSHRVSRPAIARPNLSRLSNGHKPQATCNSPPP